MNKKFKTDFDFINTYRPYFMNQEGGANVGIMEGTILYHGTPVVDAYNPFDGELFFFSTELGLAAERVVEYGTDNVFVHKFKVVKPIDNLLLVTPENLDDNYIKTILGNDGLEFQNMAEGLLEKKICGLAFAVDKGVAKEYVLVDVNNLEYIETNYLKSK
jgi:hypothetical protein